MKQFNSWNSLSRLILRLFIASKELITEERLLCLGILRCSTFKKAVQGYEIITIYLDGHEQNAVSSDFREGHSWQIKLLFNGKKLC